MRDLYLAVYFGFHDSSVAISDAHRVLLVLEAERVFRVKHIAVNREQMDQLVRTALGYLGREIGDVAEFHVSQLNAPYAPGPVELLGRSFEPIYTRHHQAHLGSVLDHGFEGAVIVCADGGSEDGTTRLYHHDRAGEIHLLEDLDDTPMTGKFYGTLTQLVICPEFLKAYTHYPGKTMGLSAFGSYRQELYEQIRARADVLSRYTDDAGAAALRTFFGVSDDYTHPWLNERRRDLAHNGQRFWEDRFCEKLLQHRGLSGNLVMVGGCALNVLLNSRLIDAGLYDHLYAGPVSNDSGQAVGTLLFQHPQLKRGWPYLGRGFGNLAAVPPQLLPDLLAGRLIAWYQGRAEVGPRGLGHRSFLGLPTSVEMRDRMNRIKGREPYRPVAPLVPEEDFPSYFATRHSSPYMTFSPQALPITRKLAPAVVHVDGTCRLQTLARNDNIVLHSILRQIGEAVGAPILMNTSFNVAGEPLVDTPDDALRNYQASGADVLYLNGERLEPGQGRS